MVVSGDHDQLERAVINLLSNAVKFTPDGGRVDVALETGGSQVLLSVEDTGIGIPLAEQGRLFERFFRSSTAQRRAIPGTGLGLSIVRGDRHRARRDGVGRSPGRAPAPASSCGCRWVPPSRRSPGGGTQQVLDPPEELARVERLDEVVVRASVVPRLDVAAGGPAR